MLELILEAFFYIMAIYGMITFFSYLMRKFWFNMIDLPAEGSIRTVLVVKDQEETIEGIIKSYYISKALADRKNNGQSIFYNGKNNDGGIIVVDMGSTDKTLEILRRLQNTYGSLEVLSAEEKDKVFEGIY